MHSHPGYLWGATVALRFMTGVRLNQGKQCLGLRGGHHSRTCSRRTSVSKSASSLRLALAAASAFAASVAALSAARAALCRSLLEEELSFRANELRAQRKLSQPDASMNRNCTLCTS